MWLDEQDAKTLLGAIGVASPPGRLATSPQEAEDAARSLGGGPVYVKALAAIDLRSARGGIIAVEDHRGAADAFGSVTGALGVTEARVEAAWPHDAEWYVAVGLMPGRTVPEILFSTVGGAGIVDRSESVRRVTVEPDIGFSTFHCRRLYNGLIGPSQRPLLDEHIKLCYQLMIDLDATLIELNPLGVLQDQLLALDARIIIDDYALGRHPELQGRRSLKREAETLRGRLHASGVEYIDLGGNIGVIGLGAGLTMHLADWIALEGGSPAFFFDATAAAVRSHSALFRGELASELVDVLRFGLDSVRHQVDALLVNFTSGGTPVDGLVRALLVAMSEIEWTAPLTVHVGGNRVVEAGELLKDARVDVQPSIGDAVRAVVSAAR